MHTNIKTLDSMLLTQFCNLSFDKWNLKTTAIDFRKENSIFKLHIEKVLYVAFETTKRKQLRRRRTHVKFFHIFTQCTYFEYYLHYIVYKRHVQQRHICFALLHSKGRKWMEMNAISIFFVFIFFCWFCFIQYWWRLHPVFSKMMSEVKLWCHSYMYLVNFTYVYFMYIPVMYLYT